MDDSILVYLKALLPVQYSRQPPQDLFDLEARQSVMRALGLDPIPNEAPEASYV